MSKINVLLMCDAVVDDPDGDALNLEKRITMPFLPRVGDDLGVGADCDYMRVEHVFWHPADGFAVQVEDCESAALTRKMLTQGWSEQ